ncbi:AraC family transcriptional regulator ligand-binding domain-containing protein, partial [Pseudomonas otitidis]
MIQFGLDHGLSLEHCLAGTGLDWQLLGDPGSEVNAAQELSLLRNIARGLGDRPGIGLEAGRRYRLNTYGIWGYALLSSSTYRSAVELGLRYLDLKPDVQHRFNQRLQQAVRHTVWEQGCQSWYK